MFEGNASEAKTLAQMIEDPGAPTQALVICEAGIATEESIAWLIDNA